MFALPDGETGPRAGWVSYERERLVRPNEGIVVLAETESPTGLPRHAYETPVFGVKPGVTGLWQVSGRSDLSWEDTIRLDLRYVENWSLPMDLMILARTILAVFRSSGAY